MGVEEVVEDFLTREQYDELKGKLSGKSGSKVETA